MLHKGIKFAYAVVMIASAAMAFIVLRNLDEATVPGASYSVSLSKADNAAGAPRVAEMVKEFSRKNHVNIGRLYYDPLDDTIRRVYLAVGDPSAESTQWLTRRYPYFSRDAKLELRPYQEISGIEPEGLYLVYGSEKTADELRDKFGTLGYRGEIEPALSMKKAVQYLGGSSTLQCLLILGLMAIVAVTSAVALNAKSYAIQRLQGRAFLRIIQQDLTQIFAFLTPASIVVGAAAAAALYWYNGLHQFGLYVRVSVVFLSFYVLALLVAHVAALLVLYRSPLLAAIKGEINATWAVVGSYILRCWGLLLLLSICTSAIASGLTMKEQHDKYLAWTNLGNAYYLRLSDTIEGQKEGQRAEERIARWIRSADARDEVSLSFPEDLPGVIDRTLLVNNRYLAKTKVYSAHDSVVQPQEIDAVQVLIPQRHSGESTRIRASVTDWVRASIRDASGGKMPDIHIQYTRNNQSLAYYGHSASGEDLTLEDPVVIVTPAKTRIVSDDNYVTIASQGGILVEDPVRAMSGLRQAGAADYVLGLSPFAQDAAIQYRDAQREFAVQMLSLLAGILVLLITALGVSIVYCRRNLQALFAKYISGWRFALTHWKILATESVLGTALVLWTWNAAATADDRHKLPGAPPPPAGELLVNYWGPFMAIGIALASLALVVLTLRKTNLKFIKAHSASIS
ncbi:hypothetical protein AB0C59_20635 [Streptomyces sp. NPDC048664]|uniref:hypothetical protein n=1 Tax=Streptomyces sp. NPDC048664 TaxID=3154505 RepID=UPI00341D00C6